MQLDKTNAQAGWNKNVHKYLHDLLFNKCKGYKKPGLKINQVKFYKLQINM